jgi:hypothetical protein
MNDMGRLDWLENQQVCALVSDDNGHWAFVCSGFQNVPFFIKKKERMD